MKAEISVWIWILGCTVVGILIFTMGLNLSYGQLKQQQKFAAAKEFSGIYSKVNWVCQGGVENVYPHEAHLPNNIKAVYSSKVARPPPEKVSVLITNKEMNVGKYLCIMYFDEEREYCEELYCDLNMTYIGTPSLKQDLISRINAIIGGDVTNTFDMVIEKKETDLIELKAEKVLRAE